MTTVSDSGFFERVTRVVVALGSPGAANISFLICEVERWCLVLRLLELDIKQTPWVIEWILLDKGII